MATIKQLRVKAKSFSTRLANLAWDESKYKRGKAWDESKYKRGKSTPGSRGGSFAPKLKEPYQMTRQEFIDSGGPEGYSPVGNFGWSKTGGDHGVAVDVALDTGKPVPEAVLADYPDLRNKYHWAVAGSKLPGIGSGMSGSDKKLWVRGKTWDDDGSRGIGPTGKTRARSTDRLRREARKG